MINHSYIRGEKMIGLKGFECQICIDDLKKHKNKINGLKSISSHDDIVEIEAKEGVDEDELVNDIQDHLKHLGHNHKIETAYNSILYLNGLNCADCAGKIMDKIDKLDEVADANYNFATQKLSVWYNSNSDFSSVFHDVNSIVKSIEPDVEVTKNHILEKSSIFEENKAEILKLLGVFIVLVLSQVLDLGKNLSFAILLIAYLVVGYEVLLQSLKNLKSGEIFDENFLMAIASIGAIIIGEIPEAVGVMLFYSVGEFFEDLAVENSRNSIKSALDLKAQYANVYRDEEIIEVDPEDVEIGEIILVKPGEKIPLDGKVYEGSSYIDTSSITGESVPLYVSPGDQLNSGCINTDSLIKIQVTKTYSDSTVAKIIDLVENASSRKSKTEKLITKFAKIYTPLVVFFAVAIVFVSSIFNILEFKEAVFRALTFLVVSCPCAFVISVPLSVFAGIGAASKSAIFVKGGNYLEALSSIDKILMDKTGTITMGEFSVVDIDLGEGVDKKELLEYAYLGEKNSTHPIAKAVTDFAKTYAEDKEVEKQKEIAGRGVEYYLDNKKVLIGNKKLLDENNIEAKNISESGVSVYVAADGKYLGSILLKDSLRENTSFVINKLKSFNIKTILLSGDRQENVEDLGEKLGFDKYFGGLLPEDKVRKLEEERNDDSILAFVGDGVNDVPVLAGADIGIAMGALGSDSAIEAADIVLLTDDIGKLIDGIYISRRTKKIVYQNIIFALGVKILFLGLSLFGYTTMWEAVFADVGVTILAVLNSIRVLKYKPEINK